MHSKLLKIRSWEKLYHLQFYNRLSCILHLSFFSFLMLEICAAHYNKLLLCHFRKKKIVILAFRDVWLIAFWNNTLHIFWDYTLGILKDFEIPGNLWFHLKLIIKVFNVKVSHPLMVLALKTMKRNMRRFFFSASILVLKFMIFYSLRQRVLKYFIYSSHDLWLF